MIEREKKKLKENEYFFIFIFRDLVNLHVTGY